MGKNMASTPPSALILDQGKRVLLRVGGRCYEMTQQSLRQVLGLPQGPAGLGITIDRARLHFEFPGDERSITVTAAQLRQRLAKRLAASA
jgi:hypothetical protein